MLLLSPTTTVQAHVTLDGALPAATATNLVFRDLNGVNTWFSEKRGVLERAGIDHDALDEATLARGEVVGAGIRIAAETYRTVVVPGAAALHVDAAAALLELAAAGGRVVCVGAAPELFLGGDATTVETAFADAVRAGTIAVVATAADVPDAVLGGPVGVRADAPFVLRRHGDAHVLALTAHDELSGTVAPILDLDGDYWRESDFTWPTYNTQMVRRGYRFVPPVDRVARVQVSGIEAPRVQSWSPGTGRRTELAVTPADGGSWSFAVPFDDGAVALVVLAAALPEPTATPLGPLTGQVDVTGPWQVRAASTLDNSAGDLAAADRTGILPVEGWRLEHSTSADGAGATTVSAGFGPFAELRGPWLDGEPEPRWRPAEFSLARGIRNDPVHHEFLGPKGYVPEEFLDWGDVRTGARASARTHIAVPERTGLVLAVGAAAPRRVLVDGIERPVEGAGYQSWTPLPADLTGRTVAVQIELVAERDGPLRASFAVITDIAAFRRPEWLHAAGAGTTGATGAVVLDLPLTALPADARVQVAADGPCSVIVNGTEIGRQSAFSPYPELREVRVHTYDLRDHLRTGPNEIALRLTDLGADPTAATLDTMPTDRGGLGIMSDATWRARRDGVDTPLVVRRLQRNDPRFHCSWARPHPLPAAAWLEPAAAAGGVVVPIQPDIAPGGARIEWLRLVVPPGTVALRVPTALDVVATVDGHEAKAENGVVRLAAPAAAGTVVALRITGTDGRRGGALLDGPVEFELAATPVEAPLRSWEELGLRALGGQVTYRTTLTHDPRPARDRGERLVLDLGEVRGTADVLVNGVRAAQLVWGPWRAELTELLRPGDNVIEIVVRGTLAGYLDDASPTSGVYAGQVRTGLFGPVRLRRHAS